jgi:site-specific DNA-methyltransferase (adenine-specific)
MTPYYQDAVATLYHADCRQVLPSLGESIDAIVTDPPYGLSLACEWDCWPALDVWQALHAALATHGLMSVFIAPHVAHERIPDLGLAGFEVLEVGFWVYGAGRPVHRDRLKRCFDLVYFTSKGSRHLFTEQSRLANRANSITGRTGTVRTQKARVGRQFHSSGPRNYHCGQQDYFPANVACEIGSEAFGHSGYEKIFAVKRRLPVHRAGTEHPTEKPLDLIAQVVRLSSRQDSIVLDPFAGSGTTLVAAKHLGRRAIGVERCETYCEMAARRLRQEVFPLHAVADPFRQSEFSLRSEK